MKALKYAGVLAAIIGGAQLITACSGYVVATGPPPYVEEVIFAAPSSQYVWMPGYYAYNDGGYVFINGSYRIPPRGKTAYTQGIWRNTPKGYKRSRGYWH